jgi:predicted  nucleic acid-binding Zn-ribbon protein
VQAVGLFKKKPSVDPAEVAALKSELGDLRGRLDRSEEAKAMLEAHIIQLDATTNALAARSQVMDDVTMRLAEVEVIKRQVAKLDVVNAKIASLDSLNGRLAEVNERLTATSDAARSTKEQVASLHERISNVSTELANQLGELSSDLDALAKHQSEAPPPLPPPPPPLAPVVVQEQAIDHEVIAELKTSQVRLANEQARYEIAFRQDLAMLAEQVKRNNRA